MKEHYGGVCPKISVRIFGVPERIACIRENQKILGVPDELIFIDERHEGCLPTAKRAWSAPTDREFTLVLTDDVELCDDFAHYINIVVDTHPDAIISLYSNGLSRLGSVAKIPERSPYVATAEVAGPGIVMPTRYVKPCVNCWRDDLIGDDTNIRVWAEGNHIQVLTTIPMLIQHIGDVSVFDPSRSLGRSAYYNKTPTDAHWEDGFVNSYWNVARE